MNKLGWSCLIWAHYWLTYLWFSHFWGVIIILTAVDIIAIVSNRCQWLPICLWVLFINNFAIVNWTWIRWATDCILMIYIQNGAVFWMTSFLLLFLLASTGVWYDLAIHVWCRGAIFCRNILFGDVFEVVVREHLVQREPCCVLALYNFSELLVEKLLVVFI